MRVFLVFVASVLIAFSGDAFAARTASCPCKNPCPCGANCTCGVGGGKSGGDKSRKSESDKSGKSDKYREEKKGEVSRERSRKGSREKSHGGGGVEFGGTIDGGRLFQRKAEPPPFAVPEGDSTTVRTQEKTKNKKPEKEVTKNPFDRIDVNRKDAKGDIPPGPINASDDNVTPAASPPSETSSQPNPPTMDDLKKAQDSFKTAEKKFLDGDPNYQASLKKWERMVTSMNSGSMKKEIQAELDKWMKIRNNFKNQGDGKKLFDDWMEKYQALNKPGAGIPDDLVPPDKLEQAKHDLMQAQDSLKAQRDSYESSKDTAVSTNTGVNKIQAEIDKLKSTVHFSDKDAKADREKVKQLGKDLDNAKKLVGNGWASSDEAKDKMKEIQKAEKDLDKAKEAFKPYEGMEKNPLKSAGNP